MKKLRVLSIDGGGIRGIIPAVVLTELEKKIQRKTGNPSARIADYFDLIAGTSVGGIIACLLLLSDKNNRPVYSTEDILNLFIKRGKDIFKKSGEQNFKSFFTLCDEQYPNKYIESVFNDYLGTQKLSSLLKPSLITAYDIEKRKAVFFRSYKARQDNNYDFLLRDVARGTSAAPTYFEPALIKSFSDTHYALIDGGIFANNPAMCAFTEALGMIDAPETTRDSTRGCNPLLCGDSLLLLSIGTGITSKAFLYNQFKNAGLTKWAKPLIEIIMTSSEETVNYQLKNLYKSANALNNYLRINTSLNPYNEKTSLMDNVKPDNINLLRNIGSECALAFDEELERFGEMLVLKQ